MQQLIQIALPVYHKQITSTSSCVSFIFFCRGKYLVISAIFFFFRAKWIVDKSLRKLFLTVECNAVVANWKAFAFLLTFRQEFGKVLNEQLTFFKIRRLLSMFYSLDFSFRREFYCGDIVYLVDPASNHMLFSKIKPCMSKYKHLYCETANGSLNQLSFIWLYLLLHGYLW